MRAAQDWLTQAETVEIIQRHKSTPHISPQDYWNLRTQELCETVAARQKIYLDTCYWIYLRDAAMGRAKKPEHSEILQLLREMVSGGSAICPVSDMAFTELMRQTNDASRLATTELLDELSLSVALQFEEYRIRCELEAFLLHPTVPTMETVSSKIWTKASYILGPMLPSLQGIQAEDQLTIQKASIDLCWARKFSDMSHLSMAELDLGSSFDRIADKINAEKNDYQHEIPSIERALVSEIAGIADQFLDHAEAIFLEHYHRTNGESAQAATEEEQQNSRPLIRNAIVNSFVYAKEKAKYMLPSMYAHALQHGAFRMDPNRKFQGSFLRDIHHGTAGVVWHDLMLTEKPLKALLTRNDVALDKTFGCQILSGAEEIVRYLHFLG